MSTSHDPRHLRCDFVRISETTVNNVFDLTKLLELRVVELHY